MKSITIIPIKLAQRGAKTYRLHNDLLGKKEDDKYEKKICFNVACRSDDILSDCLWG